MMVVTMPGWLESDCRVAATPGSRRGDAGSPVIGTSVPSKSRKSESRRAERLRAMISDTRSAGNWGIVDNRAIWSPVCGREQKSFRDMLIKIFARLALAGVVHLEVRHDISTEYFGSYTHGCHAACRGWRYLPGLGAPCVGCLSQRSFRRYATYRTNRRLTHGERRKRLLDRLHRGGRRRRLLSFLGRWRGLQRLQTRSLRARPGDGRAVPELQLHRSLEHGVPVA